MYEIATKKSVQAFSAGIGIQSQAGLACQVAGGERKQLWAFLPGLRKEEIIISSCLLPQLPPPPSLPPPPPLLAAHLIESEKWGKCGNPRQEMAQGCAGSD